MRQGKWSHAQSLRSFEAAEAQRKDRTVSHREHRVHRVEQEALVLPGMVERTIPGNPVRLRRRVFPRGATQGALMCAFSHIRAQNRLSAAFPLRLCGL